jgi:hypothetical protein
VTTAILDTSSLIRIALAQQDHDTARGDLRAFWSSHFGIDGAIEAYVLYDDLLLDGPSVRRNENRLPGVARLSEGCRLIDLTEAQERGIYQSVLDSYLVHLSSARTFMTEMNEMDVQQWKAGQAGVRYDSETLWGDIERRLSPEAQAIVASSSAVPDRAGQHFGGNAWLTLLRTLYYDRLQQGVGVDLIVHPNKGAFLAASPGTGPNIVRLFDESVRTAFAARKETWLGLPDDGLEVPLLTSYVLRRCRTWQDLTSVLLDLKHSKEARAFRSELNEFIDACKQGHNDDADEMMSALSDASSRWSKTLKVDGPKRRVTFSIPIINVGTDIDLPVPGVRRSPGDRILVFIHQLLDGS